MILKILRNGKKSISIITFFDVKFNVFLGRYMRLAWMEITVIIFSLIVVKMELSHFKLA